MQRLDAEVPQHIREAITAIKATCWLKRACSRYRRCSSLHMGLGIPRNICRKKPLMFGRFSLQMPELQQDLVNWIRSISDIDFCSIILNKYERRSFKNTLQLHDAEMALQCKLFAKVCEDSSVTQEAINCGEPVGSIRTNSRYAKDSRKLLEKILSMTNAQNQNEGQNEGQIMSMAS